MFGRQWTKKTKIAIFNDHTLIWRYDAPSPGNPREYRHKPYIAGNDETFPGGYISVADSIWVALQIFKRFCPKAGDANPLVAEPETDFNAKWPFRVIQGHLFRYHWTTTKGLHNTIRAYNKCGLRCEGSENIASEGSENRHFWQPHSHLTPSLQRTPANIRITLTLLETRIPGLHICRW